MDLAFLQAVCAELNEAIAGAFINKIHQPLPREIVLSLWGPRPGPGRRLVLSADPRWGRIHLTSLRIPNPPSPPRFCSYLRAHLQGAVIHSVQCATDDRAVSIAASLNTPTGRAGRVLVLELLGRDSNIILLDRETGLIMECLRHLHEGEAKTRAVAPSLRYEPPPPRPSKLSAADRAPSGLRAHADALDSADSRTPANDAADAYYRPQVEDSLREAYRRELLRPVTARIRSLVTRESKIHADMTRLESLRRLSEDGELLKANLSLVRKGMPQIEVDDFFRGGRRVIELDPALGPVSNMERCFRRAAKGKRGRAVVQERRRVTVEERSALEELAFFLESADSLEDLERIAAEIPQIGGNRTETGGAKKRERAQGPKWSPLIHTFRSPSGLTVAVGRSAAGNDHLVKRAAKKGDMWLHVEGMAGAHVLIRTEGAREVRPEDVEFAASLAVYYSKARGGGKVDVIVADAGHVTPVRGGRPGLVTVKKRRTARAESPEPAPVPLEHGAASARA
jgi:predicted ribosome quality control (RQC) complex YloA/Tae2 family protein